MPEYLKATRHPLPSALFVLPLLVVYEVGVQALAAGGDGVRNGADAWWRAQLSAHGLTFAWAAPVLIVLLLVVKCVWRWGDRPPAPLAVTFGIFVESAVFAAAIWALSRNFYPLLERAGVPLTQIQFKPVASGQVVQFVGAGIYEEVLFRVILFGVMCLLVRLTLAPKLFAVALAAVGSAVVFAAAHHWGEYGEPMDQAKFAFRTAAGLVFAGLYVARGLGVAVGAHAGYNILVGVSVG